MDFLLPLDGNGRTSRLLSTLCLYRAGYDFKRLFTISEYYDRDRPAFYRAIQSVREHRLSVRQALALGQVLDVGRLTIQELEALCPGVNRRTLQRDLRDLVERGLLVAQGQTNRLEYVAGKEVAQLTTDSRQDLRHTCDGTRVMSPEISERSFEEAIECALLQRGPDACAGGLRRETRRDTQAGEGA